MQRDIEYFDQIWQKDKDYKEGHNGVSPASWDKRAEGFNRNVSDERMDKIVELLLEKKMLQENSIVLDIGCGPGKFVREFAKRAQNVVGVDISSKMLHYAQENVVAQGLGNAEFRELDWEKADLSALNWKKKFSLVTGIMSPAFLNRQGLEKMLEASHEYGLICHFVERQDSISDELKKHVLGREKIDKYGNKGLYCSFNILWLYEIFPEIIYFNLDKETNQSIEEAYRNYTSRFEMKTDLTEAQKTEIMDYLKKKAENGVIKEKTKSKIACIYWRKK
ncbi:Methyltransferase [Candidatus Desulfosporosinus infrequens]|uniref:Methyltransferase n=1 Tax=Candidatus Desulfosporosinus infrequens TaxID=2043169 RepID=A0A2U3JWU0_9FIRM|nr:Methyltransferase [Candidatus Desulfosporosinus infrequens]